MKLPLQMICPTTQKEPGIVSTLTCVPAQALAVSKADSIAVLDVIAVPVVGGGSAAESGATISSLSKDDERDDKNELEFSFASSFLESPPTLLPLPDRDAEDDSIPDDGAGTVEDLSGSQLSGSRVVGDAFGSVDGGDMTGIKSHGSTASTALDSGIMADGFSTAAPCTMSMGNR